MAALSHSHPYGAIDSVRGDRVMTDAKDNREDQKAIRAVIAQMTEGFNRHDSKAATSMYTTDADLVTVRGEAFKGRAEFEKGLALILTTRARDAALKTLDVRIRFIRSDVALAHVTNE